MSHKPVSSTPSFDLLRAEDILNEIRAKSHNSAYNLCLYLDTINKKGGFSHKIATAEFNQDIYIPDNSSRSNSRSPLKNTL